MSEQTAKAYEQVDILAFDVSYLAHRNAHGYDRFLTPDGRRSGHVYGSFLQVKRLVNELRPKQLAFFYDRGSPWRKVLLPDYKATRRLSDPTHVTIPEMDVTLVAPEPKEDWSPGPDVERLFRTFPGLQLSCPEMEADDMAGWLAGEVRKSPKQGRGALVIYSADRDLWQLVSDQDLIACALYKKSGGNKRNTLHWIREETVKEAFGVGPRFVGRLKALLGDASDNIRGVEGGSRPGKKDALRTFVQSSEADDYFDMTKPCPPLNTVPVWLQEEMKNQRERLNNNLLVTDLLGRAEDHRITAVASVDERMKPVGGRLGDCLGVLVEFHCESLQAQAAPLFKQLTEPRYQMVAAFR